MNLSAVERRFCTQNIYKRGQPYFDIPKLNSIEREESLQRRKPYNSRSTIESCFNTSFRSSQRELEDRVQREIENVKRSESESTNSGRHTVNMQKMLARREQKVATEDESRFHNFFIVHYNRSVDFEKLLGRDRYAASQSKVENGEEIECEKIGKCYESLIFDRGAMKCLARIQQEKTANTVKEEKIEVDVERIRRAEEKTKVGHPGQSEFYEGKGRERPSQMDNRLLKDNEYYWKADSKAKEDFLIVKRREDLRSKRVENILAKRKIPDVRKEMCDALYFLRNEN